MNLHSFIYPRDRDSNTPPSSRQKLIFLHGLGGIGSLWRPIAATLEERFDLLCPDQRGHGGSIPSRDDWNFSPFDFARDVNETATSLGFSPAWVIGHSMGVRTALGYAKLFPNAVQGLVLIDLGFSGLAGGGVGDALGEFLRILPEEFPSRAEARDFITVNCPDPSIGQYLMAVSQVQPDGSVRFPFSHAALLQTVEAAKGTESFPLLEEFSQGTGRPVHVLRGARSQVYSAEEFAQDRTRAAGLPNVHFVEVEGAGHGLPFEKRQEFLRLLQIWLSP